MRFFYFVESVSKDKNNVTLQQLHYLITSRQLFGCCKYFEKQTIPLFYSKALMHKLHYRTKNILQC